MKNLIYELMNNPHYKAMVPRQIMRAIGSEDLTSVMKCLNSLEDEHLIIHDDAGHYALLSYFHVYIGVIDIKDSGFGFVKVEGLEKDIFVGRNDILNALIGDTVLVQKLRDTPRGPEGSIVDVIERKTRNIIGLIKKKSNHYVLKAFGDYANLVINIMPKNINKAKVDDVVSVIITDFGDGHVLRGKVEKVLGLFDDPGMDIKIMVEDAKIPTSFSPETIKELQHIDEEIKFEDYVDLTNKTIVTIDGDDAKDFDDAISVEKLADNKYLLGVYIADVSRYVKPGSAIDADAYERSFSCYLPDSVIPMLPFELSDDLCSLMPNVWRYTLACEMTILDGKVVDSNIFKAVIKSSARLTYNQVNGYFENNNLPENLNFLNDANELAHTLMKARHDKGSLDFETKEAKIILDKNKKAVNVVPIIRGDSEKMIEEFMIICNQTITERIAYLDLPFLYRVHDEPKSEKINELIEIGKMLGVQIPKKQNTIHPLFLQQILEKPTNPDTLAIFNHLILRSMAKAKYSRNNIGHFGLALENYTHFTSPIRRYPDLVVHRLIKDYLLNGKNYQNVDLESYLDEVSEHTSTVEKHIETLERDVDDMKKAEFMKNKIGMVYNGMVSGVQKWGFYVELNNSIEGLVSSEYLYDEGYYYNDVNNTWQRNQNEVYQIGTKACVKVIGASKMKGTVDFILVDGINYEK